MSRATKGEHNDLVGPDGVCYRLMDKIGRGAFGQVFKAINLQTGEFAAIKQLDLAHTSEKRYAEMMREVELLQELSHPNIVKVLGHIKTDDYLYLIFEYVEGGPLTRILGMCGTIPNSLCIHYVEQMLAGLAHVHEHGVIHRDIKCDNVLMMKNGKVVLADFGIAKKIRKLDDDSEQEVEGDDEADPNEVMGTPYWMAPEVILMSGQTPAADIWSLGCTLLEMLTGEPPYYSLPPMTAIFKIVQDECPPLPDELTEDLHDFLTQCFEKDVNKRPSAKQLLQHEWLQKGKQNSSEKSSLVISLDEDVGVSLKKTVEELKKLEPSYSPASSMNNSKSDTMTFNGLESINMDYLDSLAKDVEKDQQKETSTNEKKEETENLNKQVKRAIRELDEKLAMIHSRLEKLKEESKAMVTLGRLYGTKMNFSHIRNSLRQQNVSNKNEATIATKEEKNLMQGQVQEDLQRKREMTQRYLAYKTKIESQILNLKACMYQKATALRDFDGEGGEGEGADRDRNSDRLTFKKGDVIYVHRAKTELKMWKGEMLDKKGQWTKGYFPSDFVQIEPQKQSQQRINKRRASNIGGEMSFASSGLHRRTQPAEEKEKETKKAGEEEGNEGEEKKRKEELHSSEKKKEGKKEKKQKKEKKDEKKKKKNTLKKMVSFHKHQHSSNDSIKETKEAGKEGRKEGGEKEGEKERKDGNISLQVKEEGGAQRVTISKQFSNKAVPLSPLAEKQKSLDDAHQILSQVTEESGRDTAAFQEQEDETNNITKTSHQPTNDEPRTKKHNQTTKPETTKEELRQRIKALEAKDRENQRLISALQEENQRLRSLLGHPS